MAGATQDRSLGFLLTDSEVEEFRVLVHQHAGAELSAEEAQSVAGQIVRILAIVRETAGRGSNASAVPVDGGALPKSPA